jgi:predicted transcriptional regulator
MKSIILSVQPKWLEKILNGEKTIEIRKTNPKCELPIDVYLRCSKGKPYIVASYSGVVENEKPYYVDVRFMPPVISEFINGKVVAKFTLNKVEKIPFDYDEHIRIYDKCCIDMEELISYSKSKTLYAWHIDNLIIFDKPKELGEFYKCGYNEALKQQEFNNEQAKGFSCFVGGVYPLEVIEKEYRLTKVPQSWQYVEVKE